MTISGRRASASLLSALSVLALGAALAGCGSSDSTSTPKESTSATASSSDSASGSDDTAAPASDDQHEALASMVSQAQGQVADLIKMFKGLYSDIEIAGEDPGTLVYRYTYGQQVDGATAKAALEKQYSTLQSSCEASVFPAMKAAGVTTDREVLYEFHNSDGATIGSYTCTEK